MFVYSSESSNNSALAFPINFSKNKTEIPNNLVQNQSYEYQDSHPDMTPQIFSEVRVPNFCFHEKDPFKKVSLYHQESRDERSPEFDNSQKDSNRSECVYKDFYISPETPRQVPYESSYADLYEFAGPDQNSIDIFCAQNNPDHEGIVQKVDQVLTPCELSMKAANELASLETDYTRKENRQEEATSYVNQEHLRADLITNEGEGKEMIFHLQPVDSISMADIERHDFERNNNLYDKPLQSESDWQNDNTYEWNEVKEGKVFNNASFQEAAPRRWKAQSMFEFPETKNLQFIHQPKHHTKEFTLVPQNQPIVNNITFHQGPSYTIIQAPSSAHTSPYHRSPDVEQHSYYQYDQDAEQYEGGSVQMREDPLDLYLQTNNNLERGKKTERGALSQWQRKQEVSLWQNKRELSPWQRKQAKSAGVCVICSDKSSGWHYNVQVKSSYRKYLFRTNSCYPPRHARAARGSSRGR